MYSLISTTAHRILRGAPASRRGAQGRRWIGGLLALLLLILPGIAQASSEVMIYAPSETLASGERMQLTADRPVIWYSRNPSVARIDAQGWVTAESVSAVSVAVITAQGGGAEGAFVLLVVPQAQHLRLYHEGLDVTEGAITLSLGSSAARLRVSASPNHALIGAQWESSNADVVSVSAGGALLARKTGVSRVTARTRDGQCASVSVYVKADAEERLPIRSLTASQAYDWAPEVHDAWGKDEKIQWDSSNPLVAIVTNEGKICARRAGEAIITARRKEPSIETMALNVQVTGQLPRRMALTFDDGPQPQSERVLDVLQRYGVAATFFVIGENVDAYPDILRRMYREGHQIGNHTYHHWEPYPNLTTVLISEALADIDACDEAVERVLGFRPRVVRAPGGKINDGLAYAIGRPTIQWGVDSHDWSATNIADPIYMITALTYPDAIIVMHDYPDFTPLILERIIPTMIQKGYDFLTVDAMLARRGVPYTGMIVY